VGGEIGGHGDGDGRAAKLYFEGWAGGKSAKGETPPVRLNAEQRDALKRKLEELRSEHRDLDDVIARVLGDAPFDQLQVQRLKKRKLMLKDEMTRIESMLLPDIIA
jgi:hypothetical protein